MQLFATLVGWSLLILKTTSLAAPDEKSAITGEIKAGAEMNSKVAANVMKNIEEKGNIIFSPFSLGSALGMLLLGAKGDSKDQMLGLYEEEDEHDVGKYYKKMIEHLMLEFKHLRSKGVVINAANSIYADKAFPLSAEYEKVVKKYYRVAPKEVDFGGDPEGAKTTINTFVANVTRNMIPNLLDSVATDTKAIIVNAVYFKGVWKDQFQEKKTKEMDFHVDADTQVKAQMMHQKKSFRYARLEAGAAALEIPYKGEEMAMIFILPDKDQDLESIERKVYEMNFAKIMDGPARPTKVWIPKFETSFELDLEKALEKMGITDIFQPSSADLSGVSEAGGKGGGLYVSKIVQKCVIKVDEQGSEASAGSAVTMMMRSAPLEPVKFKADRPFMYALVLRASGLILFNGRMVNPSLPLSGQPSSPEVF